MQPNYKLIQDLLTQRQCDAFIARAEASGFEDASPSYPPSYRTNDRVVIDDPTLAETMFERVRPHLPPRLADDRGARWRLAGLNSRFRSCRYQPGHFFAIHRDGAHRVDESRRSLWTLMLYLNDGGSFVGGDTRFYESRVAPRPSFVVRPRIGHAVTFDHRLWHDGAPVDDGVKYVLRTDVMFVRETAKPEFESAIERATGDGRHGAYVFGAIELSDGRIATASRDATVRLWRNTPEGLQPDERRTGHDGSVFALAEPRPGELFSGGRDQTVRVATSDRSYAITGHRGAVLAMTVLANSDVITASADGTCMRLGNPRFGPAPRAVYEGHTSWVWAVTPFGEDGFVTASEDGTVRAWRPDGQCTVIDRTPHPQLSLTSIGSTIFVGDTNGMVRGLTIDGATVVAPWRAHEGPVRTLAAGDRMLYSGGEDGDAHAWRLREERWTRVASVEHSDFVTCVVPLSDGRLLTTSYDGRVRLRAAGDAAREVATPSRRAVNAL